jgi:hypothetical protein
LGEQAKQQSGSGWQKPTDGLQTSQAVGTQVPPAIQVAHRQSVRAPQMPASVTVEQSGLQLPATPQLGSARHRPQLAEAALESHKVPWGQPPQVPPAASQKQPAPVHAPWVPKPLQARSPQEVSHTH